MEGERTSRQLAAVDADGEGEAQRERGQEHLDTEDEVLVAGRHDTRHDQRAVLALRRRDRARLLEDREHHA